MQGVKFATLDQLAEIVDQKTAEKIREYFDAGDNGGGESTEGTEDTGKEEHNPSPPRAETPSQKALGRSGPYREDTENPEGDEGKS